MRYAYLGRFSIKQFIKDADSASLSTHTKLQPPKQKQWKPMYTDLNLTTAVRCRL
jgi:hypothetical protein